MNGSIRTAVFVRGAINVDTEQVSLSEQRYNRKLFLQIPISSISQDLMNPPKLPRFPSSNVFVAVFEGSWTQTPRVGQLQHFWDRKCFGVPCHVLLDFENFDILGLRFLSQRCLEQRFPKSKVGRVVRRISVSGRALTA